jgi:hypothetical protein
MVSKHVLKALRNVALVIKVILHTDYAIATNPALRLDARAELVH